MKSVVKLLGFLAILAVIGVFFGCEPEPVHESGLPILTGTLSIEGITQAGKILTADTSTVGGNGIITFQWKRDNNIPIGFDDSTYMILDDDIGSIITVTVTRSENSGSITSDPTDEIIPSDLPALTGTVNIIGIAEVGEKLTVDINNLEGNGWVEYYWKSHGHTVGYNDYYLIQEDDIGSIITVTVTRSENSGSVTSEPTNIVKTPGLAFTLINNGTAYSVSKGTVTSSIIIIPSVYEGLPVVAITDSGFASYTNMTDITIPSSVTSIGQGAFSGCTGLTSITMPFVGAVLNGTSNTHFGYIFGASSYNIQNNSLPASLKTVIITGGNSISNYAFYGCTNLTSITIPDSVTSIGQNAFTNCTSLTSITIPFVGAVLNGTSNTHLGFIFGASSYNIHDNSIPASLKTVIITGGNSINNYAFAYCANLTSITIPDSVTSISFRAFYYCTSLTSITIPNSVTSIGIDTFIGCTSLTSITIPNSVTSIGQGVFASTGLTSITIPNSVTSIGSAAFSNCTSLTSITIPNSVTSIGQGAFVGCTGLISITIPFVDASFMRNIFDGTNHLKTVIITGGDSIGDYAFLNCSGLTSITIPSSVTSIGGSAFSGCTSLTSISIPNSVKSIGDYVFFNCSGLTSVTIPSSVTSIGDSVFRKCSGLTSITIPSSVTSIGDSAFRECYGLTCVTISDGVTSIGGWAFEYCSYLTSITIPSSVTSIGQSAFSRCYYLTNVTISGVTSIGASAFLNCPDLTSVTFFSSDNIFSYSPFPGNLTTVYFAAGGGAGMYTRATESNSWTKQ